MDLDTPEHNLYESVRAYIPPVDCAYESIAKNGEFYHPIREDKDNDTANYLSNIASRMVSERKYIAAFHFYAKSLCKVIPGSDLEYVIHYARAELLYKTNYHTKSEEDNERAFNFGNVPLYLMLQVHEQSQKLMRSLGEFTNSINGNTPRMLREDCNSMNPEIFKHIQIQENGFVATAHIPAGTCLIAEDAACIAPLETCSLFCDNCMTFCLNPVACFNCTETLFCDELCRSAVWNTYHSYECPIISALKEIKYHLATRMALSLHDIIDEAADYPYFRNLMIDHDYLDAANTAARGANISPNTLNELATAAAQIFHLVKEHTHFFMDIRSPFKHDIFKGLLLKLMYAEETLAYQLNQDYLLATGIRMKLSYSALFALTSSIKVSCAPNSSRIFHDFALEVRAMRDIKPGEEITVVSEYYHYMLTEREKRQRHIQKRYFSKCQCESCEMDWPLLPNLVWRHHPDTLRNLMVEILLRWRSYDPTTFSKRYESLVSLSRGRDWIVPSLEWALFEITFKLVHFHMWKSKHPLTEFVKRFPYPIKSQAFSSYNSYDLRYIL